MSKSNPFIHDNFLLESKYAEELYHNYASQMPIIDYHCHLTPNDIANDTVFENITQAWIYGDHYKWRAMRTLGVEEKYVTGSAPDKEKFSQWAKVVPYTMRNPLYHWTHLELARYFDIHELLNEKSADAIYEAASAKLRSNDFSCRGLLSKMNVKVVCTTEDPTDPLDHHQSFSKENTGLKMSTSFRPDKAILIENQGFNQYLDSLGVAADIEIDSFETLCNALSKRISYFHDMGCRVSDHGLSNIPCENHTLSEVFGIFTKKRRHGQVTRIEALKYQSAVLQFLGEEYHKHGWVQQFHLGALRNNNSRMLDKLGPDTGWDSIGDYPQAESLSRFLDSLDVKDRLTKTILYNLNPGDNEMLASMIGNFNDGSMKGKMQFGSGWWFLDQKDGMTKQLNALSTVGIVSCFVGMLTDSRSFLSFPRHEYFRRILCNLFGDEIKRGELPNDMEWIGKLIQDISYNNANEYFDF